MKQLITKQHELQVGQDNVWVRATAEMYGPVHELLRKDQIVIAIKTAYEIRKAHYGEVGDIKFRVATTTITQLA